MTSTTAPRITSRMLTSGLIRYSVDGEVHTKGSRRSYTWASVYRTPEGELAVFLHSRRDLAVKGHQHGNWAVENEGWTQLLPVEIQEETAQCPSCGLHGTEGQIEAHMASGTCQERTTTTTTTTTKENDSMTSTAAKKATPAKKAPAAKGKKITTEGRNYIVPKGYEVKWQHGGHDLIQKTDSKVEGPAWWAACNEHGDLKEAKTAREAETLGALAVRATWCKGDHKVSPAKKAAAKKAAKKAQPAKKAQTLGEAVVQAITTPKPAAKKATTRKAAAKKDPAQLAPNDQN